MREITLQVDKGDRGERVDRFVAARLSSLPRTFVQRLIKDGCVSLEGRIVRKPAEKIVLPDGCSSARMVIRVPQAQEEEPLVLTPERILFHDDDLLAIDKPSGYPVVARLALAGEDVLRAARRLLRESAYVAAAHRLDAATSGVLLLAKTPEACRALGEAFSAGRVRKTYLAEVTNPLHPARGVIDAPILAGDGALPRIDPAGRSARTRFRALAGGRVLLRPQTGRTHQLRLHLASLGAPIRGDEVHGGAPAERLALHAWRLRLVHPRTGTPLRLEAPRP